MDVSQALPLVSIVTPTLQRAGYLERTVRSVRAQTYANVEHIVVDGGSTDGTLELLQRSAGTYNLRWVSEPDTGVYDAVNKGMRMAQGDVVAYLNSDDLYFPWAIEAAMDCFNAKPEVDLVYGDAIRVDESRGWTVPVFMPPFRTLATAAYGSLLQPVVFFRRSVIEELGGFDQQFAYVADMEFWLRASRHHLFYRVTEFLALEQRHPGMLSETRRLEIATEDNRMRTPFRHGLDATRIGRLRGYLRWHWWSGLSWVEFVRATRGGERGWGRIVQACRPFVDTRTALAGLVPSKGSRLRRSVRWEVDPLHVAAPEFPS